MSSARAAGNIDFYRREVEAALAKRRALHTGMDVKASMEKIGGAFEHYRAALTLYAHAALLGVTLAANRSHAYLQGMSDTLRERDLAYRELYTRCSEVFEDDKKSTVGGLLARKTAAAASTLGRKVDANALLARGPAHEALIAAGGKLGAIAQARVDGVVERFAAHRDSGIAQFTRTVGQIDAAYHQPLTLLVSADGIAVA